MRLLSRIFLSSLSLFIIFLLLYAFFFYKSTSLSWFYESTEIEDTNLNLLGKYLAKYKFLPGFVSTLLYFLGESGLIFFILLSTNLIYISYKNISIYDFRSFFYFSISLTLLLSLNFAYANINFYHMTVPGGYIGQVLLLFLKSLFDPIILEIFLSTAWWILIIFFFGPLIFNYLPSTFLASTKNR